MLEARDPAACGFVTRSTRVQGGIGWDDCQRSAYVGLYLRMRVWYGREPRPLLDVDVDAEREFDEVDAWRSAVSIFLV